MAQITLEPGESFEHYHSEASQSVLLEGLADFEYGGTRSPMIIGKEILIASDTIHTMYNTGEKNAVINCIHLLN